MQTQVLTQKAGLCLILHYSTPCHNRAEALIWQIAEYRLVIHSLVVTGYPRYTFFSVSRGDILNLGGPEIVYKYNSGIPIPTIFQEGRSTDRTPPSPPTFC